MATTITTTKCRECHRPLRAASSIAAGVGPTCARKAATEARVAVIYTPAQISQGRQLIADKGIVRVTGSLHRVVSSDGQGTYEVDPVTERCGCPAGRHGRPCYHLAAVQLQSGMKPALPVIARPTPAPVVLARPADPFAAFDALYAAA